MIHGLPLDGKLFEPSVANEINNAYSTINDKIEKFESGFIYKKEDAIAVHITSDDVSITANYSFIAGNECTISLQCKALYDNKNVYNLTIENDKISTVVTAGYNKSKSSKVRVVINKRNLYIENSDISIGDTIYIQTTFLVY